MKLTSFVRLFGVLWLGLMLTACGFHLRGQGSFVLPYQSMYVEGGSAQLADELKRAIQAGGAQLTDKPDKAQAIVQVVGEARDKVVMSLNAAGKVREYQLRLRVSFRILDGQGKEFLAPTDIQLIRNFAFDEAQLLAKEAEENLLYRDMQNDAVQQIMRRMSAPNKQ